MIDNLIEFCFKIISLLINGYKKYKEAIFVTKRQYRLRFLHYYIAKNNQAIAVIQVIIKRIKVKFSLQYLASNKYLLQDIHPVDASRISFITNFDNNNCLNQLPDYIKSRNYACPIIKQPPTIKIQSQYFSKETKETLFVLAPTYSSSEITVSATELIKKHDIIFSLGSLNALTVGYAASEDELRNINSDAATDKKLDNKKSNQENSFNYYHILCVIYVGLLISGISIVRRMFPLHIPGIDLIVPFGAGVIFFPLTFSIQDITTEVYGYARSRQMVWLALLMITFFILYTQIAVHLPSGTEELYKSNAAFNEVFGFVPRQFIALVISLWAGSLINDFFISKSKIILGGQHLWARLLGSTMIGEAVLQVVGGIIGFGGTLQFSSQLLPNMILAYGYKQLWNAAMIPIIYIVTNYLKKKENIDTYDYNINYNPFIFSLQRKTK